MFLFNLLFFNNYNCETLSCTTFFTYHWYDASLERQIIEMVLQNTPLPNRYIFWAISMTFSSIYVLAMHFIFRFSSSFNVFSALRKTFFTDQWQICCKQEYLFHKIINKLQIHETWKYKFLVFFPGKLFTNETFQEKVIKKLVANFLDTWTWLKQFRQFGCTIFMRAELSQHFFEW